MDAGINNNKQQATINHGHSNNAAEEGKVGKGR